MKEINEILNIVGLKKQIFFPSEYYLTNLSKLDKETRLYVEKHKNKFIKLKKKAIIKELKIEKDKEYRQKAEMLGVPVKKFIELERLAYEILISNAFSSGYSMGEHRVLVVKNKEKEFRFVKNNCSEYSHSCKYKARHGTVSFDIQLKELLKCQIIGGVVTIKLENKKISKCLVLKNISSSKYNSELKFIETYTTLDYHGSYEECLSHRHNIANLLIRNRRDKINEDEKKKIISEKIEIAKKKLFTFQDSLNAGNCRIGTEQFCVANNLDTEKSYSGEFLLNISGDNFYLKKMLLQ